MTGTTSTFHHFLHRTQTECFSCQVRDTSPQRKERKEYHTLRLPTMRCLGQARMRICFKKIMLCHWTVSDWQNHWPRCHSLFAQRFTKLIWPGMQAPIVGTSPICLPFSRSAAKMLFSSLILFTIFIRQFLKDGAKQLNKYVKRKIIIFWYLSLFAWLVTSTHSNVRIALLWALIGWFFIYWDIKLDRMNMGLKIQKY